MPCCVWRVRGGVGAVMIAQCAVVVAERDVVRACGACVFVCCVRVCDVACACAVLCDTRHDADVPSCCVGLVASCVSARACVWCDGVGERGAGRHVRGSARWACENVKNRGCVIRACWACIAGACVERSE